MKPVVTVIDTNIVVAGLITVDTGSPPARILDAMLYGGLVYLLSAELLNEYASVLQRPKPMRLHCLSDEEIDWLLTELVANAIWREPDARSDAPDPGDDHIWALLSSYAESVLITGDRLLVENPPRGSSVMSARGFADLYLNTVKD